MTRSPRYRPPSRHRKAAPRPEEAALRAQLSEARAEVRALRRAMSANSLAPHPSGVSERAANALAERIEAMLHEGRRCDLCHTPTLLVPSLVVLWTQLRGRAEGGDFDAADRG